MGRAKTPKEIRVETWLIRDKISRYRGILKLHGQALFKIINLNRYICSISN